MLYLRWVKEINARLRGRDVINLAGSAFSLPAATRWLAAEIGEQGRSLVEKEKLADYGLGLPALKERIRQAYQIPDEREVLLAVGASGAIRFAYQMLLAGAAGRHLVVEQPYYEPLVSLAERMGARVELAPRGRGWQFIDEAAQRIRPETAALVLTNPHNPTGDLLDPAQLQELVDAVAARAPECVIVIDETFGDLSRLAGWSTGNVDERIVTLNGLTKCYGLGSLRCGWVTADRERFPNIVDDWINFENIGCPWTELLSAGAIEQFSAWRPTAAEKLTTTRRIVGTWLEGTSSAGLLTDDGPGESCVVFPRWRGGTQTMELVERLANEFGVLVAPGEFFRPIDGMAIRIGYGGDEAALAEGLSRLETGLRALG